MKFQNSGMTGYFGISSADELRRPKMRKGLLFYGNTIIPFKDRFPKDTKLYKIMTTNPRDLENSDV